MSDTNPTQIHATGKTTGFLPAPGDKGKPITVIGTNSIRAGFDATCLQQALNARGAPAARWDSGPYPATSDTTEKSPRRV